METENSLLIVKRCLAALDRLEDGGASVNVIRSDLTTVADRLESSLQADRLARRLKALAVCSDVANSFPRFSKLPLGIISGISRQHPSERKTL